MSEEITEMLDEDFEDDELDQKRREAAVFAKKLSEQTIHDPTGQTSRRTNRNFITTYTKDTIENYLASPSQNEKALRDASIFMYQSNSRYRNLVNYYPNIPHWVYVMTPLN